MKFNLENPIIEYINTVVQFIALNLVFLLCCLPIITIGPALAALYQVTLREARGEHGYLIRKFLQHFKEMFVQGVVTFLILAALLFVVTYSIVFWQTLDGTLGVAATTLSYLLITVLCSVFIYVFPIMARFSNSIRQTLKNALLISLSNLKVTAILLLLQVFVIALLYLFPICRVLMLFIGFSFVAYCNSFLLTKLFARYEEQAEHNITDSTAMSLK